MFRLAGPPDESDEEEEEEEEEEGKPVKVLQTSEDVVCLGDNYAEKKSILGSEAAAAIVVDAAEASDEEQ